MLLAAYENPEKYKNIVVRVAGFSEYFYRLTDEMKKVVLRRTIQE
jgi:pyruvate-formate lyase